MPNLVKLGALTPILLGIMVMVSGIIIQSGLHLRSGWLILQSVELQEVAVCSKMEQTEIHRFMGVLFKFERKVAGMLKMCVSALKSEGWNLLKFDKVQRTSQMPCSVA